MEEIKSINAEQLSCMFIAGAKALEEQKDKINELNVFPVPDGDTGTNMTMTIMSAAKAVADLGNTPEMKDLAKAMSSGSLRGARGNSGVILSQLFRGFTKVIKVESELTVPVLAEACDRAAETAYKAVMKPKEGTILTVARRAADKALEMLNETDDVLVFIKAVVDPTAASVWLPLNLPTTTISTALNISCRIPDNINGREKEINLSIMEPLHISISYLFVFNVESS